MIKQFQKVLHTPTVPPLPIFNHPHYPAIKAFQEILPSSFDISQLYSLFEQFQPQNKSKKQEDQNYNNHFQQVINSNITFSSNSQNAEASAEPTINFKILSYFIQIVKENFINLEHYQALEEQTQKAEATIRSHIKLEQEMHMYMNNLQKKLIQSQQLADNSVRQLEEYLAIQNPKRNNFHQKGTQQFIKEYQQKNTQLIEETVKLKKKNLQLQLEIDNLSEELRKAYAVLRSIKDHDLCRRILNPHQDPNQQKIDIRNGIYESNKSTKNSKNCPKQGNEEKQQFQEQSRMQEVTSSVRYDYEVKRQENHNLIKQYI